MTYKEFDKKYNKRDCRGVVTHSSIIDLKGNVIFSGEVEECDKYHDDNLEVLEWNNHFPARVAINGTEVPFSGRTNVGESLYNKYYSKIFNI
jgi:hypothetical protein